MPHCDALLQTLRQLGYRITPQREMIVQALAHDCDHMTAEDIFQQVQARTQAVDIATVYRTLDLLVGAGLATRILLKNGQQVFTISQHGPHLHLVCRSCGNVLKIDHQLLLPLVAELHALYGFEADWQHISVVGTCQSCQDK